VLEEYAKRTPEWLSAKGPEADIAISCRVRLARNIKEIPYAHWASTKDLEKIESEVISAVEKTGYLLNASIVKMNELDALDKQFLIERHLISKELTSSKRGSVIIGEKEILSLMVNEEDHIRIQGISSGFSLEDTYQMVSQFDNHLSSHLEYAYSLEFGYLTACPTNVGTGMRASVMLHLPALSLNRQIEKILPTLSRFGLVSRGFYGEGSESFGDLFQISNQVSLGRREEELIENLEKMVKQIIEYEKSSREEIMVRGGPRIEDRFKRAYALLTNARIISSKEAMELFSIVRLGVSIGFLDKIPSTILNRLLMITQPAHLQLILGERLEPTKRDIKRAELIQKELKK
jgi:protein arginine kinase